ncbi:MAG: MBL fold metallo-hydrolase [Actinomycetia bacterium]|nr:MBL fold metallo-hydrolase [Actinomycetes bacterium]
MDLTKFSHSCVRLTKSGHRLVMDPGVFSESAEALDRADAVLITHEHADHFDVDALTKAVEANAGLRIWAPESVASALTDLGDVVTTVTSGEEFEAAGFDVRTFGGQHALIHNSVPVVANVCYLVDGSIYHPGDSFTVPTVPVDTGLAPIHAPWSNIGEVLDFVISLRPKRCFQIHDALLNDNGLAVVYPHLRRVADQYGIDFRVLDPHESIDLQR